MAYANAQPRKLNPASLTAAIAINGAVLAALFTAAPVIKEYVPTTIEIFTPRADPPPPPPLPDPKPTPKTDSNIARRQANRAGDHVRSGRRCWISATIRS